MTNGAASPNRNNVRSADALTIERLALKRAGYAPIPLRGKAPVLQGWQKRFDPSDDEIASWPRQYPNARNTGLLAGNTPALDVDIRNEGAALAVEALARRTFGARGELLVRVGQSPKRLIPFQTLEPFRKLAIGLRGPNWRPDEKEERLEWLCVGQQFVALGIHPETQEPYRWSEPFPIDRDQLPTITRDKAAAFMEDAANLLVADHGYSRTTEPTTRLRVVSGIDGEQLPPPPWMVEHLERDAGKGLSTDPPPPLALVKAALAAIDPDLAYDDWFHALCALFNTYGDEVGFELADGWSSNGTKYNAIQMRRKWQGLVEKCRGYYDYSIGTVFRLANEANANWRQRIIETAHPHTARSADQSIITKLEDWLARELPNPDFISGKWLTTTSRVLLDAETGIGKSMLGIALALAIAAGKPFLHWRGARPARVLYIDGEMARRVTRKRLADEVARIGEAPSGLHILSHEDIDNFQPLNVPQGQAVIEEHIQRIGGVDFIIFDNIMCLISGDQKDEEGWRQVMPWVRFLTRRCIGQLWLHHTGHDTSRSYGTKTREWQMDTHLHLDKVEPAEGDVHFRLAFRKAREREPATRLDFEDVEVKLVNNEWVWQRPSGSRGLSSISPLAKKFFQALCSVAGEHQMHGCPAAPIEEWRTACLRHGLIEQPGTGNSARAMFSKYKLKLIEAEWIGCDETMAWTIAPNPEAVI